MLIRAHAPAKELAARIALNGLCTSAGRTRHRRRRIEEPCCNSGNTEAKLGRMTWLAAEIEKSLREQLGE